MISGKVRKNSLPQGTEVVFELEGKRIVGSIAGQSTTELPVVGRGYILEILSDGVDKATYPYTHCVCQEAHFEVTQFVNNIIVE